MCDVAQGAANGGERWLKPAIISRPAGASLEGVEADLVQVTRHLAGEHLAEHGVLVGPAAQVVLGAQLVHSGGLQVEGPHLELALEGGGAAPRGLDGDHHPLVLLGLADLAAALAAAVVVPPVVEENQHRVGVVVRPTALGAQPELVRELLVEEPDLDDRLVLVRAHRDPEVQQGLQPGPRTRVVREAGGVVFVALHRELVTVRGVVVTAAGRLVNADARAGVITHGASMAWPITSDNRQIFLLLPRPQAPSLARALGLSKKTSRFDTGWLGECFVLGN